MRLSHVRFTVQRIMVAVAVVAGILALQRLIAYLHAYGMTDWGLTGMLTH